MYAGRLVPFSVQWFNGVPDFKVGNPIAIRRCVLNRLCGVCGAKMGKCITFIGGPLSIANRLFSDPAMHRQCALYALEVCPFLSGMFDDMATTFKNTVTVDPHTSPKRPDKFGLLETNGCEFVQYKGNTYIRAFPGIVRWHETTKGNR